MIVWCANGAARGKDDGRNRALYDDVLPLLLAGARAAAAKGVAFVDIDIAETPARRDEMIRRAHGRSTVPQIFIDGEHIGGCDDLVALDRAGKLDPMLGIGA